MKVKLVVLSFSFVAVYGLLGIRAQGGQPMTEEQLMRLMREVEFSPEEVPGFDTRGGTVEMKRGDTVRLHQGLWRKGTGRPGKDPTEIGILASLRPDRNLAYRSAILLTESQFVYAEGAGMPLGSWTGLPIGEKSWATAPKTGRVGLDATLVVWEGRLAMRIGISYPPLDSTARNLQFLPIDQQDLQLGEYAARLLISKVKWRLLGSRELPKVRLVVEGQAIEGMKTSEGVALVPAGATLKRLGQKTTAKLGVLTSSWKDQKVVVAAGARTLLIGKQKVSLSLPVLYEKDEMWVEGEALAKGLGLKARWEKGQFTLTMR